MGRGLIKMTAEQVQQALAMLDAGETLKVTASAFGVSINTIVQHRDRRGKNLHVKQEPEIHVLHEKVHKKTPPPHRAKASKTPPPHRPTKAKDVTLTMPPLPDGDWLHWPADPYRAYLLACAQIRASAEQITAHSSIHPDALDGFEKYELPKHMPGHVAGWRYDK